MRILWYNYLAEGFGDFLFRHKVLSFCQKFPFPQQEAKLARWQHFVIAEGKMKTAEDRFWEKVVKTNGCWLWTGYSDKTYHYGQLRFNGKVMRAHRASWEIAYGESVPDGLCVCHHCDNPNCVRPDHLFLGTVQDNMADRTKKGRTYRQPHKSHCPHGHPYSGDNLYVRPNGEWLCRECRRIGGEARRKRLAMSKIGVTR